MESVKRALEFTIPMLSLNSVGARTGRSNAIRPEEGGASDAEREARKPKVSDLGRYQGFSNAFYNGSERTSDYLTLKDGVRLAYDLILPTKDRVPGSEQLPVLFKYTPYLRTFTVFDGAGRNILAELFDMGLHQAGSICRPGCTARTGDDPQMRTPWLELMVKHGYAVIVVERPGTGASFGRSDPSFEAAAKEADQVIDWIAAQPWSNGKVGMCGIPGRGKSSSRPRRPGTRT